MSAGSFSHQFAARKTWKLNDGLVRVLDHLTKPADTVLDVGAGVGRYVHALRERGVEAYGVDGIPGIAELSDGLVSELNLTDEHARERMQFVPMFDLTLCIEVGEHIPPELLDRFLTSVCNIHTRRFLVSWAIPNQRGRDHVSCRSPEWVANRFGCWGWALDDDVTAEIREIAGKGWDHKLLLFGFGRKP